MSLLLLVFQHFRDESNIVQPYSVTYKICIQVYNGVYIYICINNKYICLNIYIYTYNYIYIYIHILHELQLCMCDFESPICFLCWKTLRRSNVKFGGSVMAAKKMRPWRDGWMVMTNISMYKCNHMQMSLPCIYIIYIYT